MSVQHFTTRTIVCCVKLYQPVLPIEHVNKGIFCLLKISPGEFVECSKYYHAHKLVLCEIVPTLVVRKVQLGQAPGCVLCGRGVCTFRFRARASFLRPPWLGLGSSVDVSPTEPSSLQNRTRSLTGASQSYTSDVFRNLACREL